MYFYYLHKIYNACETLIPNRGLKQTASNSLFFFLNFDLRDINPQQGTETDFVAGKVNTINNTLRDINPQQGTETSV